MKVVLTKKAAKEFNKIPLYLQDKLQVWIDAVERNGLKAVKNDAKWDDEALKGDLKGLRSIRLNKGYRAVYEEKTGEIVEIQAIGNSTYKH